MRGNTSSSLLLKSSNNSFRLSSSITGGSISGRKNGSTSRESQNIKNGNNCMNKIKDRRTVSSQLNQYTKLRQSSNSLLSQRLTGGGGKSHSGFFKAIRNNNKNDKYSILSSTHNPGPLLSKFLRLNTDSEMFGMNNQVKIKPFQVFIKIQQAGRANNVNNKSLSGLESTSNQSPQPSALIQKQLGWDVLIQRTSDDDEDDRKKKTTGVGGDSAIEHGNNQFNHRQSEQASTQTPLKHHDSLTNCVSSSRLNSQLYKRIFKSIQQQQQITNSQSQSQSSFLQPNRLFLFTGAVPTARLQTSIGNERNPGIFMIMAISTLDEKYKEKNPQRFDVEMAFMEFRQGKLYDLLSYTKQPLRASVGTRKVCGERGGKGTNQASEKVSSPHTTQNNNQQNPCGLSYPSASTTAHSSNPNPNSNPSQSQCHTNFNQHFVKVNTFLQFIKLFKVALHNNKDRDRDIQQKMGRNKRTGNEHDLSSGQSDGNVHTSTCSSTFIMKIKTKKYNAENDLIQEQQTLMIDLESGISQNSSIKDKEHLPHQQRERERTLLDYILIEINNSNPLNKHIHYHMIEKNPLLQMIKRFLRKTGAVGGGAIGSGGQNKSNQKNKQQLNQHKQHDSSTRPRHHHHHSQSTDSVSSEYQVGGQVFLIDSFQSSQSSYHQSKHQWDAIMSYQGPSWTGIVKSRRPIQQYLDLDFIKQQLVRVIFSVQGLWMGLETEIAVDTKQLQRQAQFQQTYHSKPFKHSYSLTPTVPAHTVKLSQYYTKQALHLISTIFKHKKLTNLLNKSKQKLKYEQNMLTAYQIELIGAGVKSDHFKDFYRAKGYLSLDREVGFRCQGVRESVMKGWKDVERVEEAWLKMKKAERIEEQENMIMVSSGGGKTIKNATRGGKVNNVKEYISEDQAMKRMILQSCSDRGNSGDNDHCDENIQQFQDNHKSISSFSAATCLSSQQINKKYQSLFHHHKKQHNRSNNNHANNFTETDKEHNCDNKFKKIKKVSSSQDNVLLSSFGLVGKCHNNNVIKEQQENDDDQDGNDNNQNQSQDYVDKDQRFSSCSQSQQQLQTFSEIKELQTFINLRRYIMNYYHQIWLKVLLTDQRTIAEGILFEEAFKKQTRMLKQILEDFIKEVGVANPYFYSNQYYENNKASLSLSSSTQEYYKNHSQNKNSTRNREKSAILQSILNKTTVANSIGGQFCYQDHSSVNQKSIYSPNKNDQNLLKNSADFLLPKLYDKNKKMRNLKNPAKFIQSLKQNNQNSTRRANNSMLKTNQSQVFNISGSIDIEKFLMNPGSKSKTRTQARQTLLR